MNRDDLELYVMGMYDGDVAALEREIAEDPAARAALADEARLEVLLRDAAAAAVFCPACDDLVDGARCNACGAAVRPGGYTVERVLISNAHGRMYAARDVDGKQVALKELVFVQSPTAGALAAFEREARFLRALEHPAIPRFCASFQEDTGIHARYYLAQELVKGESLEHRLEEHFFSEGEIRDIARQVLDVLVYLQGLSPMVIHRDIKPANLLLRPDGSIAVVDFGAAHVQGMTVGSTAIGTFGYMPLEQLAGEVDATTDLYALGASLIHLLTRREPWRLLQDGLLADVVPNVSKPMRGFLARLVAPNPRDRFASAAEARAALDRLGGGRRRMLPVSWRIPRPLLLAASCVVVAVGGAGAYEALSAPENVDERDEISVAQARRAVDEARRAAEMVRRLRDELRRAEQLGGVTPWHAGDALFRYNAPGARAQIALAELVKEMCACGDHECVEDVSRRAEAWGRDVAPRLEWSRPEVLKEIGELSNRLTLCLAHVESGARGEPKIVEPGVVEPGVVEPRGTATDDGRARPER